MTDYKTIADGDPTGDLATAYATMAAETVATSPERRMSYIRIANEVGFPEATALEASITAGIAAQTLPAWLQAAMEGEGVDINNPQTPAMIDSLVAGSFTTAMADAIKATGTVLVAKYPSLKIGHLQNAREKRLAGVI